MEEARPELPKRVKSVGWLGVVLAGCSFLAAGILLIAAREKLAEVSFPNPYLFYVPCLVLLAYLLVCSISLLFGYAGGRRGTILCYLGMLLITLGWTVFDWVVTLGPEHTQPSGDRLRPWPHPALIVQLLVLVAVSVYVLTNLLNREAREAVARIEQWRASLPKRLPFWVKVIGWFCVLAAGFNLLWHPVLLPTPYRKFFYPQLERPGGWLFLGFLYLLLIPLFVFGIGLLRRREWGRKGTILCFIFVIVIWFPLAIFEPFGMASRGFGEEVSVGEKVGMGVGNVIVVSLIVCYLMSRKVREVFSGGSPDR